MKLKFVKPPVYYELVLTFPRLRAMLSFTFNTGLDGWLWTDDSISPRDDMVLHHTFPFALMRTSWSGEEFQSLSAICLILKVSLSWILPKWYVSFDALYEERTRRVLKLREKGVVTAQIWTGKRWRAPREVRQMERWYRRCHRRLNRRTRDAKA